MFQISPKQNKFSPSFISVLFPSKWRINSLQVHVALKAKVTSYYDRGRVAGVIYRLPA